MDLDVTIEYLDSVGDGYEAASVTVRLEIDYDSYDFGA